MGQIARGPRPQLSLGDPGYLIEHYTQGGFFVNRRTQQYNYWLFAHSMV